MEKPGVEVDDGGDGKLLAHALVHVEAHLPNRLPLRLSLLHVSHM